MSKISLSPSPTGSAVYTIASPAGSTDRTLTIPDSTTTLVGTDATQTLTNKSIVATQLTGDVAAARITTALNATGSAPIYAARAWVSFNASLVVSGSGNISSITNNSAGDFTLNFATAMPDSNYSISGFVRSDLATANSVHVLQANNGATKTTTQVRLVTRFSNALGDGQFFHPETCVQIFR